MSVDGIGGGGRRPVDGPGASGLGSAGPVDAKEAAAVGGKELGASLEAGSASLGALQRGEMGLGAYLDTRVLEATKHLEGRLTTEQLDFVRGTLRDQLSSDPVLVELVRRTTSALPTPQAE